LIRTGESQFSPHYKRLGPFAKLATSSSVKGEEEWIRESCPRIWTFQSAQSGRDRAKTSKHALSPSRACLITAVEEG
jgi:hypothetical protein